MLIKNESCLRRNFAMHQAKRLFTKEEWMVSNCCGKRGKQKLDPVRVDKIKAATFKLWPLEGKKNSSRMHGKSVKRPLMKVGGS